MDTFALFDLYRCIASLSWPWNVMSHHSNYSPLIKYTFDNEPSRI